MKKNRNRKSRLYNSQDLEFELSQEQLTTQSLGMERTPRGIESEENRIYFYCPVGDYEALELNRLLRRLDVEMIYLSDRLGSPKIPIHLHISSPGGSVFAGLSIVDTIRSCKSDIHTYIDGSAASAATLISSSGKKGKRFIGKNAFMLIHQPHLEWSGKLDDFQDEVVNQEHINEKLNEIYLENTKLDKEELSNLLNHELWLPSEKCVEIGLVDKII